MKKLLKYVLVLAFSLITPIALVGCGADLDSIKVDLTTVKQTYVVNDTVDNSNVKVYAVYSDKTEELLKNEDVEFSVIDTSTVGPKTLTVTYKDKSVELTVTVYNNIEDSYEIVGFESPAFVNQFEVNKEEKTNKETEFMDRNQIYTVGTDNEFVFLPNITALNENNEPITLNAYKSVATVYVKNEDSYTKLEGTALDDVVSYNDETSAFDFTDEAVGKQFKIEVLPYYNQDLGAVSFEFRVENGYNVYNADQLSVIDNAKERTTPNSNGQINNWEEKRAQTGIGEVNASAIFIHNNIIINDSNLASYLFHKEQDQDSQSIIGTYPNIMGSLRDYSAIYWRVLKANETFTINGNYFTIDCQNISFVQQFTCGPARKDQITHAQLFRMEGVDANSNTTSKFEMKNINFIGNAQHSEETANAGGLIFIKLNNSFASAKNIITRFNVIDWFAEGGANFTVDNSRSYDSYSSMIYAWRKSQINILNSEMKRCGGPLAIIDHASAKDRPTEYTNFVVQNSVLENYVTGQEAWFDNMGVGAEAARIVALNNLILAYSGNTKTYIKKNDKNVDVFNCLYVLYDGGNLESSDGTTKGTVDINGFAMDLTGNDLYLAGLRTQSPLVFQLRSKVGDAYTSKYIYANGLMPDGQTPTLGTYGSSNKNTVPQDFAGAEGHIGLVFNASMAIVLGLYDVA